MSSDALTSDSAVMRPPDEFGRVVVECLSVSRLFGRGLDAVAAVVR